MAKWSVNSKQCILNNHWRPIELWKMTNPDGVHVDLYIEAGKDAVIVFALTTKKRVLYIDQFFYAQGKKVPTLIAGYVEENMTPIMQAKQELLEEAGCVAKKFISVGTYFRSKYHTGNIHFVLALDVAKASGQVLDVVEDIDTKETSLKRFVSMLLKGTLQSVVEAACAHTALQYLLKKKLVDPDIFAV